MPLNLHQTAELDDRSEWFFSLKRLFPVSDEYELAAAIYSFDQAFEDGLTPQQAYDDFDRWTQE